MPDVYDGGDDNTVMKELQRLAEQGDAKAQFELGFKYAHGQGVEAEGSSQSTKPRVHRPVAQKGHREKGD